MTADQVFTDAKARFRYASDQCVWGKPEYWATLKELTAGPAFSGDCDDFAGYCVGMLRRAGLPGRYVTCRVETGELHCVAECAGQILDNRQDFPMPKDRLPYQWIAISGTHPGEPWHKIIK